MLYEYALILYISSFVALTKRIMLSVRSSKYIIPKKNTTK